MIRDEIAGAVARGWCAPANETKDMDADLAEAITDEVMQALDGKLGLADELRELRLTIAAALAPETRLESQPRWVRLELFGHSHAYGVIRDVDVAGKRFIELVQPAIELEGALISELREKLYHPNAVYALGEGANVELDVGWIGVFPPVALNVTEERARTCICPSHASNRDECPVHDEHGRARGEG